MVLARYLSQFTNFKKTVIKAQTTLVQGANGPVMQMLAEPVIALFQQAGCTEWERKLALDKFDFKAIGDGEDPVRRVSAYDTDTEADRHAWSPETKRQIEALLDAQQGVEYFRVERPRRPAPWPTYDEITVQGRRTVDLVAEQIQEKTREMGFDPSEIIAYERENLSRTAVIQALEALLAPEPEQDLVVIA